MLFLRPHIPTADCIASDGHCQACHQPALLCRYDVAELGHSEGLPRFALVPPLLQHAGLKSFKCPKFDEGAKNIWEV